MLLNDLNTSSKAQSHAHTQTVSSWDAFCVCGGCLFIYVWVGWGDMYLSFFRVLSSHSAASHFPLDSNNWILTSSASRTLPSSSSLSFSMAAFLLLSSA